MRTITKIYNVYNYFELSEEAKEKAKQWYLDNSFRPQEFEDIYTEDLRHLFANSELKLQFSLSYCQGDGLNIYGKLNLTDVFNIIRDKKYYGETFKKFWNYMTEQEQKTIEAYTEICGRYIDLPYNRNYTYCIADKTDFAEEWINSLEYYRYRNIQVDTIRKMEKLVIDIFTSLSKIYEGYGYKYFYEVDEEEMNGVCEVNGWEFLGDGTFYIAQ